MKKLLGFIILCIPLYVCGDNLIFNPGFDMIPWDTGWTSDTSTTMDTYCFGEVYIKGSDEFWLPPRSCELYACVECVTKDFSSGASARVEIYQKVPEVINCTCRVYYEAVLGEESSYPGYDSLQIMINGSWECGLHNFEAINFAKWEKFYTISDTVSGIKFIAYAGENFTSTHLWIDNVYIGGMEVGVEEDSRLQIAECKVEISPNPFIQSTTIKYHIPSKTNVSLKIYDITGRRVKTLVNEEKEAGSYNISFDARGLTAGIYFVKLVVDGVKTMKKLTILR